MRLCLLCVAIALCICSIPPSDACCPAPPANKPVVNADQTVLIIWDAEKKIQHFIRQASFKSDADEFGFIVPSPSEPELAPSDQSAFLQLAELTKPDVVKQSKPVNFSCGCSSTAKFSDAGVTVLQEKFVAGFKAVVLEAKSTTALANWLAANGFANTPELQAWAEPYVKDNWKFTALKLAKESVSNAERNVNAAALRMSFQTDKPLFPYREPESALTGKETSGRRILRIFMVADARMTGVFPDSTTWNGNPVWSNKLPDTERQSLLEKLKLPKDTGPMKWHLTVFDHDWPYERARGDVYFERDRNQDALKRPPHIIYTNKGMPDVAGLALILIALSPALIRRLKTAP